MFNLEKFQQEFGINNNLIAEMNPLDKIDSNKMSVENKNSFSNILRESIAEVNDSQKGAYDAMEQIATGKVENLQEAVRKIESAELSLKLSLEVKNKALASFKQIMTMQI